MNRKLDWPGFVNARTLEGIAVTGGHIKPGALFRTERAGLHATGTEHTLAALERAGVSRIIDLRVGDEFATEPLVTKQHPGYLNIPIVDDDGQVDYDLPESEMKMYADMADHCGGAFIAALRAIITAPPGGVMVHCTAGKDRTGIVAALVLGALGASDDDIADDYTLTRESFEPFHAAWVESIEDGAFKEYLRTHDTNAPREVMVDFLDHLRTTYGGVEFYLKQHGFGREDVDALHARLVDKRDRAGVFVRHGTRVALLRRERAGLPTYWVVPGGGVDAGESFAQAAVREVKEELGVDCTLGGGSVLRVWFENRIQHYFEATTQQEELVLGGPEIDEQSADNRHIPEWVELSELPGMDLWPAEAKEYLLARLRGGDVVIRPIADAEEFDRVADVVNGAMFPASDHTDWRVTRIKDVLDDARDVNLVAEVDGMIVGGVLCRRLPDVLAVGILGVDQRWQRIGIGALLLAAVEKAARSAGDSRLELGSQPEAAEFYRRCGWTHTADMYGVSVFQKEVVGPDR